MDDCVNSSFFPVPEGFFRPATLMPEELSEQQALFCRDPDAYWRHLGNALDWITPFTQVKDVSFAREDFRIRWFHDGVLNVSVNCIDRHLAARGDQVAFIFEGDESGCSESITYNQLSAAVNSRANLLKKYGVQKGDRVTLYLPMIPDAAYFMLACARIGAVHNVIFGGFSADSIAGRVQDCHSDLIVTANEGRRGGKTIPLKPNVDKALESCSAVRHVLVVEHTNMPWVRHPRDVVVGVELENISTECAPEPMQAEDPLFILYTSGSTGKPKGVLHTTGGYLSWAAYTHKTVFDYQEGDIYWCTADIGWVTGHSYVVYGPLANGATSLIFEGVPSYPDSRRFWQVIDAHRVNIFYTAPTAIRALMRHGDDLVKSSDRKSLRLLGSVGEPINPEAWRWYHEVVGDSRCPIVDTWWQTETGGILIAPVPGVTSAKPGSATKPLPGIMPELVDAVGQTLHGPSEGNLCIADSWPGQMRTVYGDQQRFFDSYFSTYPGKYFTGDGARRDEDGYFWITGRVDDVLNVSGHRLGTAEIESALGSHAAVAEAAVVGFPHDMKGQGIWCYVTVKAGIDISDDLKAELRNWVRVEIGPLATPDVIQIASGLPKTRSGKIMRRILRKIAEGRPDELGDISTLADPAVVAELINASAPRG